MGVGEGFVHVSALQHRVRAQARRIEELESGGAYARERDLRLRLQREYESQVRRLRADLRARERLNDKMARCWLETYGQVQAECDAAVAAARGETRLMEERALRAERRADRLEDALTAAARRIRELEAEAEGLGGLVAKLTAQVNRDFENSSIPSSMQPVRRKGVPNTRQATGRPRGAQPGHPHHPRRRPEPTRVVELPDPRGWDSDPDLYRTGEAVSKVVVSARVAVEATEYRAAVWRRRSNGSRVHAPFPGGVSDEVCYDASCKALAFLLTSECNASLARAARFLSEASGGALSMSVGMVAGLAAEFSAKSAPERAEAVASLMSSPVMHADFTCANVGGEGGQVLILANPSSCLMIPREHKGHEGVRGTPLEPYVGCVEHDHDTTFYSYGTSHQECMQHNIRYLVGSVQNEPDLTWNREMLALLREMVHWRKSVDPGIGPDPAEAARLEGRYDEILGLAEREYAEHPPSRYYADGYNLFRRLRDYRDSELRFLRDMRVQPDNSLCERLARVFKRRQRACIAFRSAGGLAAACDAITAVNNMRSGGEDVFERSKAIFGRPMPALLAKEPEAPA